MSETTWKTTTPNWRSKAFDALLCAKRKNAVLLTKPDPELDKGIGSGLTAHEAVEEYNYKKKLTIDGELSISGHISMRSLMEYQRSLQRQKSKSEKQQSSEFGEVSNLSVKNTHANVKSRNKLKVHFPSSNSNHSDKSFASEDEQHIGSVAPSLRSLKSNNFSDLKPKGKKGKRFRTQSEEDDMKWLMNPWASNKSDAEGDSKSNSSKSKKFNKDKAMKGLEQLKQQKSNETLTKKDPKKADKETPKKEKKDDKENVEIIVHSDTEEMENDLPEEVADAEALYKYNRHNSIKSGSSMKLTKMSRAVSKSSKVTNSSNKKNSSLKSFGLSDKDEKEELKKALVSGNVTDEKKQKDWDEQSMRSSFDLPEKEEQKNLNWLIKEEITSSSKRGKKISVEKIQKPETVKVKVEQPVVALLKRESTEEINYDSDEEFNTFIDSVKNEGLLKIESPNLLVGKSLTEKINL